MIEEAIDGVEGAARWIAAAKPKKKVEMDCNSKKTEEVAKWVATVRPTKPAQMMMALGHDEGPKEEEEENA